MNEETVLPEWLHDIFLGYGDPAAAQYSKLPNTLRTLDFKVHLTMTCMLRASPYCLGLPGCRVLLARSLYAMCQRTDQAAAIPCR